MQVIESVLGNVTDNVWSQRAKQAKLDTLVLNQWDAQKNRFRRLTEGGAELAVSLDRHAFLRDGDVLVWNEATKAMTVARLELRDVLVIKLQDLVTQDVDTLFRTCVELGHALGNQHWPAVVKEGRVYVPLAVDRKVMESVMKTHAFKNIQYSFAPAPKVIPYLLPHEARRLFGGAEQELSHGHEHGHHHH